MKSLNIGNLRINTPIIQGGMGIGISLSGLASAVANEGGMGVISAVGIGMTEPDYRKNFKAANRRALIKEIRTARSKTDGAIGVNIMMAVSDFEDLLSISIKEKADAVFIGAGLPLRKPTSIDPAVLETTKTKFIPKVSSARAANLVFKYWSDKYNHVPDALVIEGPLAGGHLGFKKNQIDSPEQDLKNILEESLSVISIYEEKYQKKIPIIVGGGIYTGKDILEVMQIGAGAVKMGTRFVTTKECDASPEFKKNYLNCKSDDITIIDSPVGLPGRVIKNSFVQEIKDGKQKPVNCTWKCLKTCNFRKAQFCIAEALFSAARGNFKNGFSFAGSKAFLSKKIISVQDTFRQIRNEYILASQKMIPGIGR